MDRLNREQIYDLRLNEVIYLQWINETEKQTAIVEGNDECWLSVVVEDPNERFEHNLHKEIAKNAGGIYIEEDGTCTDIYSGYKSYIYKQDIKIRVYGVISELTKGKE